MNHPESIDSAIQVHPFGIMAFREALALQRTKHAEVCQRQRAGWILWGEHPLALTLGKHAAWTDIQVSSEFLEKQGFDVVQTDRGGKVTMHNPGQLVVYPIIGLFDRGVGVRAYIRLLEASVIDLLRQFDIVAHTEAEFPGIWVGTDKIGAVGVRVNRRVSMHGLSLNICNDLGPYKYFIPCGIQGRGVTSVAQLLGTSRVPSLEALAKPLVQSIAKGLIPI